MAWRGLRLDNGSMTSWRSGCIAAILTSASLFGEALPPCEIQIAEAGTGWPVPMVQLRTTHNCTFVSDNAGLIAFDLPELMGRETWFEVFSHGYEVPADGFGNRGVRLSPEPGKQLRIEVQRTSIARRLGRLTGAGLFAESQKLGKFPDWRESGVLGCDSTQNAVFKDRLFWIWGDTTLASYPLGIFNASGATTVSRPLKAFAPPLVLPYELFRDSKGAPRGTASVPGEGPTWLSGLAALTDQEGKPRLVAAYVKVKPPMETYESGLIVWDEETSTFLPSRVVWRKSETTPRPPPMPEGHAVSWKDTSGVDWVLFGNPFPTLRCKATFEAWSDPKQWETLTPQNAVAASDGKHQVKPHTGSIAWNTYRKRWVTVFMEKLGKPSAFGELWYAESDSPTGPWGPAVKVLSHQNYTFYNPKLHPLFSPPDSLMLFFEGTYTTQFSDAKQATPRYDYNQLLYRLDLDDSRLRPAIGSAAQ